VIHCASGGSKLNVPSRSPLPQAHRFVQSKRLTRRDFDVHWPKGAKHVTYVDCTFDDVDFGRVVFTSSTFERCAFNQCVLTDSHFIGCRIVDSTFLDCDLRGCHLGSTLSLVSWLIKATTCSNVTFERCDFRDSFPGLVDFVACQFKTCDFRMCDFLDSVFEDCLFESDLNEVIFRYAGMERRRRKNPMRGCDFRTSDVSGAIFSRIDLDLTQFSIDDRILIIQHGSRDIRLWRGEIRDTLTEGQELYIEFTLEDIGSPGFMSTEALNEVFTRDQVDVLKSIVSRGG